MWSSMLTKRVVPAKNQEGELLEKKLHSTEKHPNV